MVQNVLSKDILPKKMDIARHLISLWYHALMSDGKIGKLESTMLHDMFEELFEEGRLFADFQGNKDELINQFILFFHAPLAMSDIYAFIHKNPRYANMFYDDACSMIIADMKVTRNEKRFLKKLARNLAIYKLERNIIHKKYFIHI